MSTDVYFDFHTPELYLDHDNWSKWYSKLVKLELSGKESYFTKRVSHLSNLECEGNIDRWELFQLEFSGILLVRKIIPSITELWYEIFNECQKSKYNDQTQPKDIVSPDKIYDFVDERIGYHLVIRQD